MNFIFRFIANLPPYMNDVPEIVRAYSPYIVLNQEALDELKVEVCQTGGVFRVLISQNGVIADDAELAIDYAEGLEYKKLTKRFVKTRLHGFCRSLTSIELPYGSLTGVRPTKLYYELIGDFGDPKEYLRDTFFVSDERARLIEEVVQNQKGIYSRDPNNADIFINIPFCPTRCKYCSFISSDLPRIRKKVPEYILAVKAQCGDIVRQIDEEGSRVRAIYVGGGTPTSLEADELVDLLSPVVSRNYGVEFTVEAGRPDSITREKLAALKDIGVTRLSINPQTFNDATLTAIGRAHTTEQIYKAYGLARGFGFDINMDLIAGLPGESFEDFENSIEKTLALRPENITVHTLSIKRGAVFMTDGLQRSVGGEVKKCVDFSRERLKSEGYRPYYMYRQKNMADNLENVGYCLEGKQCVYNIDYMEETTSIFSAGAGAMSKRVYPEQNRIERYHNAKGLDDYLASMTK